MIAININLSEIPKDQIFEGKKGKYITLIVDERKAPDNYGNTHTVYISQSKEEREAKKDKQYIGSGKLYSFEKKAVSESQTPFTNEVNNDSLDQLPF